MGARDSLVGRAEELGALTEFLGAGEDDGLVLTGEAGLGKTALWEAALDVAVALGTRVLVATPGEGEERYSFGVLTDLLREVDLDELDLPASLRGPLDAAVLREPATGGVDVQLVAAAVHDVLRQLADGRRVLVCVDDVQWADPASLEALTFAARRLTGRGVAFLLTRRVGFDRSPLEALLVRRRLRYVEPRPLTAQDTSHLLAQHLGLVVPPRVVRMVHEEARGNPLHALEIGRVLLERGTPGLGEPLGVPEELATVLGVRVQHLPEEHQALLLALALEPQAPESILADLVGVAALDEAVRTRLVSVGPGGRVRPWHPLLAAAAREGASPARRRELHLRLAELATGEEARARHLALAHPEADEELAEVLTAAAALAGDRGAALEAAELAELALERTPPDAAARPGRVVALAERLAAAGESTRLSARIEPEIESLPLGAERGTACLLLLDGIVGSMDNLEHWIERAMAECDGDPGIQATVLQIKAMTALGIRVSGVPAAQALAEEAGRLGQEQGIGRDWFLVHTGRRPETDDPHPASKWHLWRGEPALAEPVLREEIAAAEAQGRMRALVEGQLGLSDLLLRTGRLTEARELLVALDDALMADKESRDEDLLRAGIAVLAGDAATGEHWARLTEEWAVGFGHGWIELDAIRWRGVAALLTGDPEEALRHLQRAWDWVVGAGIENPGIFPVGPDLVEALVLLGRYDDARGVLAWLEERAVGQDHPWGLAGVDRCRALIGLASDAMTPAESAELARRAADRYAELGLRPDEARTCLAMGGQLRRRRQWGLAREALDRARAVFVTIGGEGWVALADQELAKVGGRTPSGSGKLTPAERGTAELAAQGLSNKEIARRTGVAIGTVEAHLSRSYLKLGVRSRSQLAGVLGPASEDDPGAAAD
jgi:DNA-binding CsgD family transcriptional regulator